LQREKTFAFSFPECEKLAPPVMPFINVSAAFEFASAHAACLLLVYSVGTDKKSCPVLAISMLANV